jgi:hypothetical protein
MNVYLALLWVGLVLGFVGGILVRSIAEMILRMVASLHEGERSVVKKTKYVTLLDAFESSVPEWRGLIRDAVTHSLALLGPDVYKIEWANKTRLAASHKVAK